MPLVLKDLDFFKTLKEWTPEAGARLAEMIETMAQGVNNMAQQTNSNPTGTPEPPPPINSLNVTAENGQFDLSINHEGAEFYRGVHYFAEHADNPNFVNPQIVHMGTSRNARLFLGNAERYVRAYAQYPGSAPGKMAYFGSEAQPFRVRGGGSVPSATFGRSQGSGTGQQGQGHSGFGPEPFRSNTGKPPIR